ncbi:MAG: 7-cyano-7-deazaguanine synthase, partial [Gemmatimonadota bacterium]|nr:7-cyano-7-deazaguanine synthase [Gemmatimonadota bacterium]
TRSFLYASLAAVIAQLFKRDRILFYENGITSVNLPISEQVVGVSASRTTHPMTLHNFSEFISALLDKSFAVENPFFWKTKADVVESLKSNGYGHLIKHSRSCSHTREQTKQHTHCGKCSQCIDRRFATLASGNEKNEPGEMYAVDLLTGAREKTEDRTMLAGYINTAKEIEQVSDNGFFARFPEIYKTYQYFPESTADILSGKYLELYRKHASQVGGVIEKAIKQKAKDIRQGILPESCAVMIAIPNPKTGSVKLFKHSPDYRKVSLKGNDYALTALQAQVIKILHEDCADSNYEMGQASLLEAIDSTSRRLRDLFKSSKGAWGKLIVSGSKKGTVRLNL